MEEKIYFKKATFYSIFFYVVGVILMLGAFAMDLELYVTKNPSPVSRQPKFYILSVLGWVLGLLAIIGNLIFNKLEILLSDKSLVLLFRYKSKVYPIRKMNYSDIKNIYLHDYRKITGNMIIVIEGIWEDICRARFTKIINILSYISIPRETLIIHDYYYPDKFEEIGKEICKKADKSIIDEKLLKYLKIEKIIPNEEKGKLSGEKRPIQPQKIMIISILFSFFIAGLLTGLQHYIFHEQKLGRKLIFLTIILFVIIFSFLYFIKSFFWELIVFNIFIGELFARYQKRLVLKFENTQLNKKWEN